MSTLAGLDLSKAGLAAGPKALGLGSGQSSDRAGVWDLLKEMRRLLGLNAEGANAETGVPWRWV